jgi:phosphopantothenoylcysteine decarboxylase/phosphopantothenate--cysteine ligase
MDVVVKAAAVADYRPLETSVQKIKKRSTAKTLRLIRTDDILDLLGKEKKGQILIGFAAETESLLGSAREKLKRKNLDMLVANDVSSGVFGADAATVHIMNRSGEIMTLQECSKREIAGKILDLAQTMHLSHRN